ncbi:MAG: hypothetical protein DLM53_07855 [Candidatus Eremiobacter antarcticus]|nr:MAG: hypothetical protein DLM53_07855 [Candidatus Eremiobacter sp. RRmetagenome_bin22]
MQEPQRSQLLTAGEVCRLLRISTTSLYELMRKREIAYLKIGRSTRFEPAEISAFIGRCRPQTGVTVSMAPRQSFHGRRRDDHSRLGELSG